MAPRRLGVVYALLWVALLSENGLALLTPRIELRFTNALEKTTPALWRGPLPEVERRRQNAGESVGRDLGDSSESDALLRGEHDGRDSPPETHSKHSRWARYADHIRKGLDSSDNPLRRLVTVLRKFFQTKIRAWHKSGPNESGKTNWWGFPGIFSVNQLSGKTKIPDSAVEAPPRLATSLLGSKSTQASSQSPVETTAHSVPNSVISNPTEGNFEKPPTSSKAALASPTDGRASLSVAEEISGTGAHGTPEGWQKVSDAKGIPPHEGVLRTQVATSDVGETSSNTPRNPDEQVESALLKLRKYSLAILQEEHLNLQPLEDFPNYVHSQVIVGDGNCQFRAISMLKYGTQDQHEQVRRDAIEFLMRKKETFAPFIAPPPGWIEEEQGRYTLEIYLENMKKLGTWGDEHTLSILSEEYGLPIVTLSISEGGGSVSKYGGEGKCYGLFLKNAHYEMFGRRNPNAPLLPQKVPQHDRTQLLPELLYHMSLPGIF